MKPSKNIFNNKFKKTKNIYKSITVFYAIMKFNKSPLASKLIHAMLYITIVAGCSAHTKKILKPQHSWTYEEEVLLYEISKIFFHPNSYDEQQKVRNLSFSEIFSKYEDLESYVNSQQIPHFWVKKDINDWTNPQNWNGFTSLTGPNSTEFLWYIDPEAQLYGIVYPGDKLIKVNKKKKSILTTSKFYGDSEFNIITNLEYIIQHVSETKHDTVLVKNILTKFDPVYPVGIIERGGYRIGYSHLRSIPKNSSQYLEKKLKHLIEQGIDGFILDLRGNGGGYLDELEELMGIFIHEPNAYFEMHIYNNNGKLKPSVKYKIHSNYKFPSSILKGVLVDTKAASGSEILAHSFREFKNLKKSEQKRIFGLPTWGKAVVTVPRNYYNKDKILLDFSLLRGEIIFPSGFRIQRPFTNVEEYEKAAYDYKTRLEKWALGENMIGVIPDSLVYPRKGILNIIDRNKKMAQLYDVALEYIHENPEIIKNPNKILKAELPNLNHPGDLKDIFYSTKNYLFKRLLWGMGQRFTGKSLLEFDAMPSHDRQINAALNYLVQELNSKN